MVFAACQVQEKNIEQHQDIMTFVDLTKPFDMVCRVGFWKIMMKFGLPEWFVKTVRQFHERMMARVLGNERVSYSFEVTNGVKQG